MVRDPLEDVDLVSAVGDLPGDAEIEHQRGNQPQKRDGAADDQTGEKTLGENLQRAKHHRHQRQKKRCRRPAAD